MCRRLTYFSGSGTGRGSWPMASTASTNAGVSRGKAAPAVQTVLVCDDLEMDLLARQVKRAGQKMDLQPREFRLLESRVKHLEFALQSRSQPSHRPCSAHEMTGVENLAHQFSLLANLGPRTASTVQVALNHVGGVVSWGETIA